jgi:hypothetical protein
MVCILTRLPLMCADVAEVIEDRVKKGVVLPKDESGEKAPAKPDEKEYYVHYVDCEYAARSPRR